MESAPSPSPLSAAPVDTPVTVASADATYPVRSFLLGAFRFFSSLKLALILLAVLIVDLAAGTIIESKSSSAFAKAHIYDSWWFSIWLAFLIINLTCAALARYPWKPHLTGFVITHAGIITMLLGAKMGQIGGLEGGMSLHIGDAPKR